MLWCSRGDSILSMVVSNHWAQLLFTNFVNQCAFHVRISVQMDHGDTLLVGPDIPDLVDLHLIACVIKLYEETKTTILYKIIRQQNYFQHLSNFNCTTHHCVQKNVL